MTWIKKTDWGLTSKGPCFGPDLTHFIDRDFAEYYLGNGKWMYEFKQGDTTFTFDEQYVYQFPPHFNILKSPPQTVIENMTYRGTPLPQILQYLIQRRPENQLRASISEIVAEETKNLQGKLDALYEKYKIEFGAIGWQMHLWLVNPPLKFEIWRAGSVKRVRVKTEKGKWKAGEWLEVIMTKIPQGDTPQAGEQK